MLAIMMAFINNTFEFVELWLAPVEDRPIKNDSFYNVVGILLPGTRYSLSPFSPVSITYNNKRLVRPARNHSHAGAS